MMWYHLSEVKVVFSNIHVFELGSPKLKKLAKFCAGRVLVLLYPSLYKALRLTYPIDISSIVRNEWMTSKFGTGNLGQSVGVLIPTDFRPYVNRLIVVFFLLFRPKEYLSR